MRICFLVIIMLFLFGIPGIVNAQTGISLNFNLGSQPVWGPTGYDYVENYYMPDIEVYYNVPTRRYYYYNSGSWIYSLNLPSRYRSYDLYTTYKVVVNDRDPWTNHITYREKYSSFKGRHTQQVIRDSKEQKYFVNKNHPEHNNWIKEQNENSQRKIIKGGKADNSRKKDAKRNNQNKNNGKGNK